MIEDDLMSAEAVKAYSAWVCRGDHVDRQLHDNEIESVRRQWPTFASKDNDFLCTLPKHLTEDCAATMWEEGVCEEEESERHSLRTRSGREGQHSKRDQGGGFVHGRHLRHHEIAEVLVQTGRKSNTKIV